MIERAAILHDLSAGDEEKRAAAEYYVTLGKIKEKCYAERDAKKNNEEVKDGKPEDHD